MSRPYLNLSAAQLRSLAQKHWNSQTELLRIREELRHRTKYSALVLLQEIEQRLKELGGKPKATSELRRAAEVKASMHQIENGICKRCGATEDAIGRFRWSCAVTDDAPRPAAGVTSNGTNESTNEDKTKSDDFFGGDVNRGIERIRTRLLDLTNRNHLLNYTHFKKSSLRVIDEVPDILFNQLLDGKEFYFAPVNPPPRRDWPYEEVEEDGAKKQRQRMPTPAEHARSLGIRTSFELTWSSTSEDTRHNDRAIQTLHYPDELESILRNIASKARLSIEETGSNILYLAFGFLAWYESAESEEVHYAPLVLIPVAIEKGVLDASSNTYKYSIRYSGEDVIANVSLQEKMRRDFNLEIPDLEDDEAPASYCKRVTAAVRTRDRWEVKPWITLTLLAFGKLLMYRDLDPRNWPRSAPLSKHPRIREFFEGIQRDDAPGFAHDYPIDKPPFSNRAPVLIEDADSSQHSALIDCLDGKNLVIQGPPGTGKSQTITNFIAGALAAGKSVLFVSEKLAALEVVRHRLNRAGLGDFCLELHSNRTKKSTLIEDLRERIDKRGKFSAPRDLDNKIRNFNALRQRLTDYADLINSEFGAIGKTIHDIFWWCQRARSALPIAEELLGRLRLKNVVSLDAVTLEAKRQTAREYARHVEVVSRNTALSLHPWFGVNKLDSGFYGSRSIESALADYDAAVKDLISACDAVSSAAGFEADWSFDLAREFVTASDALPQPTRDQILERVLPALDDETVRKSLEDFTNKITRLTELEKQLTEIVGAVPDWDTLKQREIHNAADELDSLLERSLSLEDALTTADSMMSASRRFANASNSAEAFLRLVHHDSKALTSRLIAYEFLTSQLQQVAPAYWELRHPGLESDSAVSVLQGAVDHAARIDAKQSALEKQFIFDLLPGEAEATENVKFLAAAGWWSVFTPSYWRIRRTYKAMSREHRARARLEMRDAFAEVASYHRDLRAFDQNEGYRKVCGPSFNSTKSPLAGLLDLARLYQALVGRAIGETPAIYDLILSPWQAPTAKLRRTAEAPLQEWADHFVDAAALHAQLTSLYTASFPDALEDIAGECKRRSDAIRLACDLLMDSGVPKYRTTTSIRRALKLLGDYNDLLADIRSDPRARAVLGEDFAGEFTNIDQLIRTIQLHRTIVESSLPPAVQSWLISEEVVQRLSALKAMRHGIATALGHAHKLWAAFVESTDLDESQWYRAKSPSRLTDIRDRAAEALESRALPEWLDYVTARQRMHEAKLTRIVELVEDGQVTADGVMPTLDFIVANSFVKELLSRHPVLAEFNGTTQDEIRRRFAEIDREILHLTRRKIAYQIDQRPVPYGNSVGAVKNYTEFALIERECTKQKRHIPIRQLISRAGAALKALKPCFMMGPLAVAQYLPPGHLEFDVLVMDEASQLKPEDALGAIARAKQVVIVGDPMQLPPTSFFERIDESPDEEEAQAIEDSESILDVAANLYRPVRMLKWHYRSRHGSLIAFSNREFYNEKLIVFPSPNPSASGAGVKFYSVEGTYANRKNVQEARAMVSAAIHLMKNEPNLSLGLVTLNSTQQELVENELEQRLKQERRAAEYVQRQRDGLEPLFVKNLENVQGDERDVIMVSITYGPNEDRQVYQRFGPINGATGHRRLNVLFTRARERICIFSSMRSSDIITTESSAWGARALKGYLEYAETGVLERALFTGRDPDSDFEVEVAEAIRKLGYDAVAQVGVAGFFIDIAIRHPRKPDRFILGVECDGATYHSAASARDRDRLRQSILESLKWNIIRIWSVDWFKNPERQLRRIHERVEALLAEEPPEPEFVEEPPVAEYSADQLQKIEHRPQRRSVEEARAKLVEYREKVLLPAFPRANPAECILRDDMIEVLLQRRPVDHGEWLDRIPMQLRMSTDIAQVSHLSNILAIIETIA